MCRTALFYAARSTRAPQTECSRQHCIPLSCPVVLRLHSRHALATSGGAMRLTAARSRHRTAIFVLRGSVPSRGSVVVLAGRPSDLPSFSQLMATEEVT